MKNLILLLFAAFLGGKALACHGSCLVYHAAFTMTDGTVYTGYFEVSGHNEPWVELDETSNSNAYGNSDSLLSLVYRLCGVSENERSATAGDHRFTIYKNYYLPEKLKGNDEFPIRQFGLIAAEEKIDLDIHQIRSVEFLEVRPAERDWLNSELVETTGNMIRQIYQGPYRNYHYIPYASESTEGYLMLNFNPELNRSALEKLGQQLNVEQEPEASKQALEQHGVLLVYVWAAP